MFENHDVKHSVILSVIHNNSCVMQSFYEKEQSNWYPSHTLVLRSVSMTVLHFNRVCQLSLACNGSPHISLKEYMNLLVNKNYNFTQNCTAEPS